ncbi:MAG TPA: 5,6-dimethylbenzimidazole synthase [Candidatus Polarisedimenticolia bacterium]|nr:5,6-dimethylbenzimidazole synthase [Candidatus Polarisedimenticolia bacterium]
MARAGRFTTGELQGVYRAIRERRDVRSGFLPEPLSEEVLDRLMDAAHRAPSVGLMQPWRFILIRAVEIRKAVHDIFLRANQAALDTYEGDRRKKYASLKLEGILEAPQNLCIVCNPECERGHRLGRFSMPETALYSAVCAVQNLWLAARAEGIGVGWVSILDKQALHEVLHIPENIVPVAYLCLGYVDHFAAEPDLERAGWERRIPLDQVLAFERYDPRWRAREEKKP